MKNILIIRFRQLGDAILATSLINTLHQNFPEAQIDFVLNERLASFFEGHPAIHKIIPFTEKERHNIFTYLRKIWKITHSTKYDAIIDLRSTINTSFFALFSLRSPYRIGIKKAHSWIMYNYCRNSCSSTTPMVEHNASMALPLKKEKDLTLSYNFSQPISHTERENYKKYLSQMGIDFNRPIIIGNITAKLSEKIWNEDRMKFVLKNFLSTHPEVQMIFNYAPGKEEENARRIYKELNTPSQVFIDIQAKSAKELLALSSFATMFFGNEGGARHIAHSAGTPTLAICAPGNYKKVWIAQNSIKAEGISPLDFCTEKQLKKMDYSSQYSLIEAPLVLQKFNDFYKEIVSIPS